MKRAVVLTTIVVAGLAAASVAAQQQPAGRQGGGRPTIPGIGAIEKITDDLYKISGAGGNTVVFIRDDGVVLVDTKLANNGEAILKQVRTVTDKPVAMIINTHSHPDHIGSNDYFTSSAPSVQVVAHQNTGKRMAAMPNMKAPDRSFSDRLTLGRGDDQIDLYYFGAGHTDGDAFVVFPSERTMMAGDIMAWNMAPLIDPMSGGSAVALPDTLEKAVNGIRNVDRVIEGHGHVNTWQGFRTYAEFNRAVLTSAKAALGRGGTPEQALAELEKQAKWGVLLGEELLPGMEYGGTPKSRALININVAFQELKGEPVTTNWGPPRPGGPGAGSAPPAARPAGNQ